MSLSLLSITIGINPNMFDAWNLILTWHGFFTFIAVAMAVYLVTRWGKNNGMVTDAIHSVAVWAILGGIIGARLFHVIDFWSDIYGPSPAQIFKVWQGGISVYGAVLGGFAGGAIYMWTRNHPVFLSVWAKLGGKPVEAPLPTIGALADVSAPAVVLAMAVGRIGDIINGEHFAKATKLPWGFIYEHPATQALYARHGLNALAATHPAVVYEMIWDLVVFGVVWALRTRIRPPGMIFALFLALYSAGKFFISYLRLDNEWAMGLREAQFVAIAVMAITIPLLVFKAKRTKPGTTK